VAATVASILVTPVKGMRVAERDEVKLDAGGAAGDRSFFLVGEDGAMVNITRIGPLAGIIPEHDLAAGRLTLRFPDGGSVTGPVEASAPKPCTFYGLKVDARPVRGPFSEAISELCGTRLRLMLRPDNRPATDRGWDGGVTLLARASIGRLERAAAEAGETGPIDERRFRMTFNLEGIGAHAEDAWVGQAVRIGDAEVLVEGEVGRCAATTRDPETGIVDVKVLHHLASYRREQTSAEALPFGIYGRVTQPGTVRVGDGAVPGSAGGGAGKPAPGGRA
jgi:uncharacterized protein YcbX